MSVVVMCWIRSDRGVSLRFLDSSRQCQARTRENALRFKSEREALEAIKSVDRGMLFGRSIVGYSIIPD